MDTRISLIDRVWWFRRATVPTFFREGLPRWVANKLPRRVVYFAFIRAWAKATPGDRHPCDTTPDVIAKVWQ